MAKKSNDDIDGTKSLMGALVRMKPKPHEEMKVGKKSVSKKKKKSVSKEMLDR
ncbi:hypothetical protein [Bradyrhizobium sp.]